MVPIARHSVRIERPVDEVWDFLVDLERVPSFFPGVLEMRPEDDLAAGTVGKRYAERALLPLRGGEARTRVEVVESVPGEKLAIQSDLAPVSPRVDFDLRDVGDGHTRVQWTCRSGNEAAWLRIGVLPLARRVLGARAVQGLENLKRRLELPQEGMRALRLEAYAAGDEGLRLVEDAPLPELRADDVLVRVVTSSVNPIDWRRRDGYGRRVFARRGALPPLVLGHDLAGVVVGVGSGVRRFRPGDAVWGAPDAFRDGAWAELVAVRSGELAPKPATLSWEEAAALPYVALTTWSALERAGVGPERAASLRALVHAGSGGVGHFAVQLLKAWGAWVATTCSTRNVEWVRELGADRVIDYTREDYARELRDLDLVIDTLGDDDEAASLGVLAEGRGAQYVSLVHPLLALTDRWGLLPGVLAAGARLAARKAVQRFGHGRGYHWSVFAPDGRALAEVGRLVEAGRIRAVVDRVVPLAATAEALAYSETGRARGKIVIRVAPDPGETADRAQDASR